MKIAYLAAGAADMVCGSCLHDNRLAASLMELGEEVVLIPTYTPLRTDEPNVSQRRVFFGGVNVYLQQKSALFRHTPWWFDRLFDLPPLLQRLSQRATSVEPAQLGELTVSMLLGKEGRQRKELDKLLHWLATNLRPDVVHLSNSMLLGMAPQIAKQCGTPVVCSLSGEDIFLEKIPAPYYDQARRLLRAKAAEVDAFIAMNNYYADFMADYLKVDRRRVHVIPPGLQLDGHGTRTPKPQDPSQSPSQVIGYLARICEDKGLHLLVEACEQLMLDPDLPPIELRVAGYLGQADRSYLHSIERRIAGGSLAGHYEYVGELDRNQKIAFLQSLDIFSLPTVYRESKGLSVLEALANAVPVVLPRHGCFPELIESTGGGLLCEPLDSQDLASTLAQLLRDPSRATTMGLQGQGVIRHSYHAKGMAEKTRDLYQQLVG